MTLATIPRYCARVIGACAVACLLWGTGCASPPGERLNSPPQGWSSRPNTMQDHYVYMVDNAMLSDMHVSDAHFVPHTAALNSLGARRLDRYATFLKEYGGTLYLDTKLTEASEVDARLAAIRQYIEAAGVDLSAVKVETGLPSVASMSAEEAAAAYDKVTSPDDTKKSGGGAAAAAPTGIPAMP